MSDIEELEGTVRILSSVQTKLIAERDALRAAMTALIDSLEPAIHLVGVRIVLSEDDRVAICASIDAARRVK